MSGVARESGVSRRLLIVRLSALGDIIHTIPAVAALRAELPRDVRIGWVVESPYRELIELVAPVDEVFTVATKRWRRQPFARATRGDVARSWRALRQFARGATSIDFQGLIKSSVIAWSAGSSVRYAFAKGDIREKPAAWFSNRPVEIEASRHVVEWNVALARGVAPGISAVPDVDFRPLAADPERKLNSLSGKIVLLPGAGKVHKQWPTERFRELAAVLATCGERCVAVWGPGERELAEAITAGGVAQLAPATSLRELAFLLANARLVVAGDTGPLHLAAALHTPVVALFGPTNPRRNGPYRQDHGVVESSRGARSMHAIEVDEVVHVALQQLSRAAASTSGRGSSGA